MKKNLFKAIFVAAFALLAGYNVYTSQKAEPLSDLALANVEALASGESNDQNQCYQVFTPADWFHADQVFVDCFTCTQKKGRNFDQSRSCSRN